VEKILFEISIDALDSRLFEKKDMLVDEEMILEYDAFEYVSHV